MNTYVITFTDKSEKIIVAYSYSESDDGMKYIFHKKQDKSDTDTFVFAAQVRSIDNMGQ